MQYSPDLLIAGLAVGPSGRWSQPANPRTEEAGKYCPNPIK